MTPIRVQRKRTRGYRLPENTICVTRGTKWGNPFKIGSFVRSEDINFQITPNEFWSVPIRTNLQAATAYKYWIHYHPKGHEIAEMAKIELKGKNLACWCSLSEDCHADVLLRIANEQA